MGIIGEIVLGGEQRVEEDGDYMGDSARGKGEMQC